MKVNAHSVTHSLKGLTDGRS